MLAARAKKVPAARATREFAADRIMQLLYERTLAATTTESFSLPERREVRRVEAEAHATIAAALRGAAGVPPTRACFGTGAGWRGYSPATRCTSASGRFQRQCAVC